MVSYHVRSRLLPGSEDGNQTGKVSPTILSGGGSSPSGAFAASLNSVSMILGGEEASRWGKAGGADAGDDSEPPRLAYLRAKSAATRCGGGRTGREGRAFVCFLLRCRYCSWCYSAVFSCCFWVVDWYLV